MLNLRKIQAKLPSKQFTITDELAILKQKMLENKMMKFKTLLALLILITPALGYAGMYKYQDEKGNWVYSQHPPESGDFKTIKPQKYPRSSNISNEARKAKVLKARESVIGKPGEKAADDKVAEESSKNADKRKEACEKSKKALSSLEVYRRFKDKDGKIITLEEEERLKRIKIVKENIKQFCD